MSTHETLGLMLVRDGLITRPQLYDALRLQRQSGYLLGTCLLSLGYLDAARLLDTLSRQLAVPALRPGLLGQASPDAIARVPREVASRLRIVPYSWDGEVLGVAVPDGRVLTQLDEVAYHSRSAVGAYVAMELEIDAAIRRFYGEETGPAITLASPPPAALASDRPRPVRATSYREIPSRDFGSALGLEPEPLPMIPTPAPSLSTVNNAVIRSAPPRARAAVAQLERVSIYDAIERLYEAREQEAVGLLVGQATLNYFSRVAVCAHDRELLRPIGVGGVAIAAPQVRLAELPHTARAVGARSMAYGAAGNDPRAAELWRALGIAGSATALIAAVATADGRGFMLYADNGDRAELYEELHDIEMLFKEAETALGLLVQS